MARLLWLPDVLRDAGLKVIVMPGAETRGRSDITVKGIVWHATVTKATTPDINVANLLRDGHSTLAGPLAQLGPARNGTIYIPALGRCNHNGYGLWGNDTIGMEFFNDGYAPFTTPQMEAGIIATAAILKHLGRRVDAVKAHKETDPRRKIDPPVNMNLVRENILKRLDNLPVAGTTEEFTVSQYEDIKARLERIEGGVLVSIAEAREAKAAAELAIKRIMPLATQQEAARNTKRAALAAGAVGVEGVTDEVRQP